MDANEVSVALAAVAFVGLSFGTWRQAKIAATTLVEKEYEVCGWLARILLQHFIATFKKNRTASHAKQIQIHMHIHMYALHKIPNPPIAPKA